MRLSVMIFITNIFEANFPECITLEASLIVADFIISVYSASCNVMISCQAYFSPLCVLLLVISSPRQEGMQGNK